MRTVTIRSCFFLCAIALALAVTAFADDQEKATTEIKRITSISVDANMRSIVNRTMADMLKVSRLDLVKQRQELNLNYGALFLTHQLTAGGAKMEDIAAQLKAGKKIFDIANDRPRQLERNQLRGQEAQQEDRRQRRELLSRQQEAGRHRSGRSVQSSSRQGFRRHRNEQERVR